MSIIFAGCEIEIFPDSSIANPRIDFENIGTMVCSHPRYILGDENGLAQCVADLEKGGHYRDEDIWNPRAAFAFAARCGFICLPLFLYEHSGFSIATSAFSDSWDSGQAGFIYMTPETAIKNWGKKRLTRKVRQQAITAMEYEVKLYDQYLVGDVWGFSVRSENEEESCWGFYGYDCCLEEAKSVAEGMYSYTGVPT